MALKSKVFFQRVNGRLLLLSKVRQEGLPLDVCDACEKDGLWHATPGWPRRVAPRARRAWGLPEERVC